MIRTLLTAILFSVCALGPAALAQQPTLAPPQGHDLDRLLGGQQDESDRSAEQTPAPVTSLSTIRATPIAESVQGAPKSLQRVRAEEAPALRVINAGSTAPTPAGNADRERRVRPGSSAELTLKPASSTGSRRTSTTARNVGIESRVPLLHVATSGPGTLVVGRPARYVFTLSNRGEIEAHGAEVRVALPAWISAQEGEVTAGTVARRKNAPDPDDLVWSVDRIGVGGEETLTVDLTPREGKPFELAVDWSVKPTLASAAIDVRQPMLEMEIAGPKECVFGATTEWAISLANPGTGDARQVDLKIFSGASELATLPVGTVEAGAQRQIGLKLRLADAGRKNLRAVAVAEPGLKVTRDLDLLVRSGKLGVELTGPAFEYSGAKIEYVVRVTNSGNADLRDVAVQLSLPGNTRYLGGHDSAEKTADGLAWTIDRVAPGAEQRFRIACELRDGGSHQFNLAAKASSHLPAADSMVTRVQSVADLTLDLHDPKGPQNVGGGVEYEIRVANRGTASARQVHVVAICSADVETIDVTGSATIDRDKVYFRPIAILEPGKQVVYRVTVRALKEGNHIFRAVVICDTPDTRLASEELTRFYDRSDKVRTAELHPLSPERRPYRR